MMIIARIRIAHVPYAKSLALTKKKVIESATKPVEQKTTAQTARGTARVAHVPQTVSKIFKLIIFNSIINSSNNNIS